LDRSSSGRAKRLLKYSELALNTISRKSSVLLFLSDQGAPCIDESGARGRPPFHQRNQTLQGVKFLPQLCRRLRFSFRGLEFGIDKVRKRTLLAFDLCMCESGKVGQDV
jgi:hypothetical protein